MKYDILIDFPGSQDGSVTEQFAAGTQRELSDYLAAIVVPCGWAKAVEPDPVAVVSNDYGAKNDEDKEKPRRRGRH